MTIDELFAEMDSFDFWSVKTINGGNGRHARGAHRVYECRIVHNHRTATAQRKTPSLAITEAIRKHRTNNHELRLVGGGG